MEHDKDNSNFKQLTLSLVFNWILQHYIFAICFYVVMLVVGVSVAFNETSFYRSEATLIASDNSSGGGGGLLSEQFGGLASLAGVNLQSKNSKVTLALEILRSREYLINFIENNDLLETLLLFDSWDKQTNQIILSEDTVVLSLINDSRERALLAAYEEFNSFIVVNTDNATGVTKISLDFYTPFKSQLLLESIVKNLNEYVRERDKKIAKKSIEFLNSKIPETNLQMNKTILYQLLEQQIQSDMFAEITEEYVFRVIDPPYANETAVKPKRLFIVASILFFALIVHIGVAITMVLWKEDQKYRNDK